MKQGIWCALGLLALIGLVIAGMSAFSTRGEEGKIVLSYTRWGDPSEMDSTKELIQQFMDENPDIVVRVDVVSWEQYWQKMATAVTTGTAQDVWLMSPAYVEQYAGKGAVLDLMPFIDNDATFKLSDYFPHPFDDFCFTEVPVTDDQGTTRADLRHASFRAPGAKCFAFTRDYNCRLLYYNRDHFDAAALPYPTPDWTWDDLVAAAKKLTIDRNGDGMIDQWGYFGLEYDGFARTNGGKSMDVVNRKSTWSTPEFIEAIRFCQDLIYKHKVAPSPDLQVEGQAFTTGKASMTVSGVWNIRKFNKSRYLWDMTSIPTDTRDRKRITAGGGMGHCIYAGTKHPKEAWMLVKFLSSEKSQRELAKSGTSVPVLKSAAKSEDFLAPFDRPPKKTYPLIFENLMGEQHVPTHTRGYLEYSEKARDIIHGVWLNRYTPEEACKKIDEVTDKILAEQYEGLMPKREKPPKEGTP